MERRGEILEKPRLSSSQQTKTPPVRHWQKNLPGGSKRKMQGC
jgi:hypothetical protein